MTASERMDELFADALQDLAAPHYPDYFDDVLQGAVRGSQRPGWTFPERWLPVSTITNRWAVPSARSLRPLSVLLVILALLLTALVVAIGSRPALTPAPPYGPAANGLLAYGASGDIYARDVESGSARLIVGGPAFDVNPFFSHDGTRLAFYRLSNDPTAGDPVETETIIVANADGTDARALVTADMVCGAAWSPDATEFAVITVRDGVRSLLGLGIGTRTTPRAIQLPIVPYEGRGLAPARWARADLPRARPGRLVRLRYLCHPAGWDRLPAHLAHEHR